MADTKPLPWTLARLHDPAFVDTIYGQYMMLRLVPSRPTPFARSVCSGQYPEPPDDADLNAPMDHEAVEAYSGFPTISRRGYWSQYGLSNSPMANGALRQPRA